MISKLILTGVSIGVLCITDTVEDKFLLISDGARSLYIDTDDDFQYIKYFSSLTEE